MPCSSIFSHRRSLVLFLFSMIVLVASAHAQTAAVSGMVHDPNQLAVPGAQVSLVAGGGASPQTATTDNTGHYSFTALGPGSYTLTANKAGFDAISVSVMLNAGASLTADLSFTSLNTSASVTVEGIAAGSAIAGYYVGGVDRGLLGTAPIVNQPYTITVLPAQQITNTQVRNLRDALKYLPLVEFTEQQGPEIIRPATRGVQGAIAQNTLMDGMNMAITGGNPMEQYQELQVEDGLGAAIYGPANPSGVFDFVLKRPTEQRFENLFLEQDSSSVGTIWGDAGGRLGPHEIFGYRTNLLFGDGTQFVEASRLRRRLAMFAFDLRPTDRTTLDAHYSVYDIVQRGYPGWFTYGENKAIAGTAQDPSPDFVLPAAPDPTRVGYGEAYAGVNLTTQSTSARLLHDFSPNWHAMAGGLAQRLDRFIDEPVNNITSNTGNYTQVLATGFAPRFGIESDLGYITGDFNKWGIKQNVVLGSDGYRFNTYGYHSEAEPTVGMASIDAPKVFAAPTAGLPDNTDLYQSSVVHQQSLNVADLVTLPDRFLFRVAASQAWIGVDNYTLSATTLLPFHSSGSNKEGISPSASIMYKPETWMTAYGTFASSLQQGDAAPGGTVNANQALAPYRSKEWEVGFKTDAHPIAITTDLFRIQRPFADTVSYNGSATQTIFEIVGLQVNYGAEIQGQGTLFHHLLVDAGFTALNARLNNTGIAATDGKRFVGIPAYKSGFYSEYRVPGLASLAFTGDWQFSGRRPQDDENLHSTPGYNTFDLGFRYAHPLFDKLATLRFTSDNITNTRYFSTIAAGDITGTNASSNTAHQGNPRTISTSLEFSF